MPLTPQDASLRARAICSLAPVVPVLVIHDAAHARPLAEALVAGGLPALEVTLRTPAALDAIRANPGIDQAGVAALIAYDRATIGGVIDRLEHKGLVERRVSARDRRAREVSLSEAGEEAFAEALPVVRALQEDILPGLSAEERRSFLELAARVAASQAGD